MKKKMRYTEIFLLIVILVSLLLLTSCTTMITSAPPGAKIQEKVSTIYIINVGFKKNIRYKDIKVLETDSVTPASVDLPSIWGSEMHIAWRVVWPDGTVSEWNEENHSSFHFIKSLYTQHVEKKTSYIKNENFSDSKPVSE